MDYEKTSLWEKTLGIQGDQSIDCLRASYLSFREHMKGLLNEVRIDFPNLTDHSIEHVDNLWGMASLITGDAYPINPLEGYILGCSFLVHDAVLSYKAFGGRDVLRQTVEWKDSYQDIVGTIDDTEDRKKIIDFKVIRQLHAQNCGDILLRQFEGMDGNLSYLLTDDEMRKHYGQIIGDIASSHHWEADKIQDLPTQVNPLSKFPSDWVVCPRKLACILRCADAAAIDSGRAPEYLFRLLLLNGVSKNHWVAQNRLGVALDVNDPTRLVITSTCDFEEKDFAAWNVAYDAVGVIDDELGKCQGLLSEQEQFQVKSVAGARSRKALSSYIKTKDWMPSDVSVHISNVARLITTLGGKELYGKEDHQLIVLRELIQNARDAIHARRLIEGEENFNGKISVKVCKAGDDVVLSVTDNGVGMSLDTISHSLLDFGNSFWHEDSVNVEFPGLKSAGFESVGQYGIGFFSVFMIAKSVMVESRKFSDGLSDAHIVKFPSGLTLAPIFANCKGRSTSYSTVVSLHLKEQYEKWPTIYEVKRNQMNSTNFEAHFSAVLSVLVSGLDVDVYYKEFDEEEKLVHHRIFASDFDKKAWLRELSFADYQQDKNLDDYIDANYNRLQYIYDERHRFAGLAAIGTRFLPLQDFLGGSTIGGLLTGINSRTGEQWIGIIDNKPESAKRGGGEYKASPSILRKWAETQVNDLGPVVFPDFPMRFRLQLAMHFFKADPSRIAVAFCFLKNNNTIQFAAHPLEGLVELLASGKKLIFVDSTLGSKMENEGHGDVYLDFNRLASNLNEDEILYNPLMNSGFLSYKIIDGVPRNDYGFIDCLYRMAVSLGYKIVFSYIKNYVASNLGLMDRALVIEVKK